VQNPLQTTTQLAELIASVVRKREPGKNPATRSFQAIRIKVNQELDDVEACLHQAVECLAPGGRLVVISFHSLEDRIVKHFLREVSSPPRMPKGLPVMPEFIQPPMKTVGKALRPSEAEVQGNVRSRSAIMRVGERAA
jgi:16S rRNA (cytosine1402-N4)-methyltransferase